jgi:hypothetical protein
VQSDPKEAVEILSDVVPGEITDKRRPWSKN